MGRVGPLLLIAVAIIVRIIIAKPVADVEITDPNTGESIINVPNRGCPHRCHRRDVVGRCRMNWTCYIGG